MKHLCIKTRKEGHHPNEPLFLLYKISEIITTVLRRLPMRMIQFLDFILLPQYNKKTGPPYSPASGYFTLRRTAKNFKIAQSGNTKKLVFTLLTMRRCARFPYSAHLGRGSADKQVKYLGDEIVFEICTRQAYIVEGD